MSKTRRRKRVSKKYKGGADLKKMHKENEEMYEYYLNTMGDLTEIKNEYSKKDEEDANVKSMFEMMDELEKIKPIMYSILETKIKINKKKQELNIILKLTEVNISTLQKAIEDVDTYAKDFFLDINQILSSEFFVKKNYNRVINEFDSYLKIITENIYFLKIAIKEKEGVEKNTFKLNSNSNIKERLQYVFDALKFYYTNTTISTSINYNIEQIHNSVTSNIFEKFIKINKKYINQVLIEFGYKKENENFDTWINGRPEERTELKKWVFQNNTNLKQFKNDTIDDSKKIKDAVTEIKETEKAEKAKKDGEDKNENEVNFLIETYPDALDFFKNPKPPTFTKYTTRITKKRHNPMKRRIDEVNNRLALIKHYKKINDWKSTDKKDITAVIDDKGKII